MWRLLQQWVGNLLSLPEKRGFAAFASLGLLIGGMVSGQHFLPQGYKPTEFVFGQSAKAAPIAATYITRIGDTGTEYSWDETLIDAIVDVDTPGVVKVKFINYGFDGVGEAFYAYAESASVFTGAMSIINSPGVLMEPDASPPVIPGGSGLPPVRASMDAKSPAPSNGVGPAVFPSLVGEEVEWRLDITVTGAEFLELLFSDLVGFAVHSIAFEDESSISTGWGFVKECEKDCPDPTDEVPVPATFWLFGAAIAGLGLRRMA